MNLSRKLRCCGALLIAAAALMQPVPAAADTQQSAAAADLTRETKITASNGSTSRLQDRSTGTAWKAEADEESWVALRVPDGEPLGGLYLSWSVRPAKWRVQLSADGERWSDAYIGGAKGPRNEYIPLADAAGRALGLDVAPAGLIESHTTRRHARIVMESGAQAAAIFELRVLGAGVLPDWVERWKPVVRDAELMVISAHPDDETVFFGGVLPRYAGEEQRDSVVVYMTVEERRREVEALGALWTSGVETYPVFGPFPDRHCETLEACARFWGGKDKTVAYIVEQFRRFRPEVVVTHDVKGEYVHGAHLLTAWAVQQAVAAAADPAQYPESAQRYGAWQVQKCYLHLYRENPIVMDWNVPLARFGGRTAFEVAEEALQHHVSELHWNIVRVHDGKYSTAKYGLFYSAVGPDTAGGDLFENIR
jgi:LmbE family N-acetylglucosaminyl deacetylase